VVVNGIDQMGYDLGSLDSQVFRKGGLGAKQVTGNPEIRLGHTLELGCLGFELFEHPGYFIYLRDRFLNYSQPALCFKVV
jgi:hypothetical protein